MGSREQSVESAFNDDVTLLPITMHLVYRHCWEGQLKKLTIQAVRIPIGSSVSHETSKMALTLHDFCPNDRQRHQPGIPMLGHRQG
jgi:hypothetical protein